MRFGEWTVRVCDGAPRRETRGIHIFGRSALRSRTFAGEHAYLDVSVADFRGDWNLLVLRRGRVFGDIASGSRPRSGHHRRSREAERWSDDARADAMQRRMGSSSLKE